MSFFIINVVKFFTSLLFYVIIVFGTNNIITSRIIAVFINTCMILEIIVNFKKETKSNKEVKKLRNYIANLENKENIICNYCNETKEINEELMKIKHDMKNDLQIAYAMVNRDKEKAVSILDDVYRKVENIEVINFCKNDILNAILTIKLFEAKNNNIRLDINVDKNAYFNMEEIDICNMFSNILDNSIDACKKCYKTECCEKISKESEEQKEFEEITTRENGVENNIKIKFSIFRKNNYIVIKCENAYIVDLKKDNNGKLITTKENEKKHGYGMKIIESIVNKYDGEMNIITKSNIFKIIIVFKNII